MSSGTERYSANTIEISGWDADENFFVEKAEIQNCGDERKRLALRARVRVGSLLFLRMSEGLSLDRAVPAAYQVVSVAIDPFTKKRDVEIAKLRPRESSRIAYERVRIWFAELIARSKAGFSLKSRKLRKFHFEPSPILK